LSKIITIDNASVDTEKFRGQYDESQRVLEEIALLQEDFKAIVDSIAKETKLKKNVVSGFFKARFKAKTAEAVQKGEMFQALNEAVENK
jgi:hypothetical protein